MEIWQNRLRVSPHWRASPRVRISAGNCAQSQIMWHGESHLIRHKTAPVAFNLAFDMKERIWRQECSPTSIAGGDGSGSSTAIREFSAAARLSSPLVALSAGRFSKTTNSHNVYGGRGSWHT